MMSFGLCIQHFVLQQRITSHTIQTAMKFNEHLFDNFEIDHIGCWGIRVIWQQTIDGLELKTWNTAITSSPMSETMCSTAEKKPNIHTNCRTACSTTLQHKGEFALTMDNMPGQIYQSTSMSKHFEAGCKIRDDKWLFACPPRPCDLYCLYQYTNGS